MSVKVSAGGDARPEQLTADQIAARRKRLEARIAALQALASGEAHRQLIRQFHAARPTTAQIRGRADQNHQQIELLLEQPCTRAANRAVDRYQATAEALDAFAARLELLEVIS
jgi:hypothetical protein